MGAGVQPAPGRCRHTPPGGRDGRASPPALQPPPSCLFLCMCTGRGVAAPHLPVRFLCEVGVTVARALVPAECPARAGPASSGPHPSHPPAASWSTCTNTRAPCCTPTTRRPSPPSRTPCTASCPTMSTRAPCPPPATTTKVRPASGARAGTEGGAAWLGSGAVRSPRHPGPAPLLLLAVDEEFETVSTQLLKRTHAMLNKYRLLLLEESRVGPHPPAPAARREVGGEGCAAQTAAGCAGRHVCRPAPRTRSSALLPPRLLTRGSSLPPEGEPVGGDGDDRPNVHSGGEDHPCLG